MSDHAIDENLSGNCFNIFSPKKNERNIGGNRLQVQVPKVQFFRKTYRVERSGPLRS